MKLWNHPRIQQLIESILQQWAGAMAFWTASSVSHMWTNFGHLIFQTLLCFIKVYSLSLCNSCSMRPLQPNFSLTLDSGALEEFMVCKVSRCLKLSSSSLHHRVSLVWVQFLCIWPNISTLPWSTKDILPEVLWPWGAGVHIMNVTVLSNKSGRRSLKGLT